MDKMVCRPLRVDFASGKADFMAWINILALEDNEARYKRCLSLPNPFAARQLTPYHPI
ncbi:hypothetical protein [Rubritalea tangerina]|uniref:hypothetical protein n=1 Tax=Rubritalea tangerina TaxID=430798 RepID=UPI0036134EEE